MERLDISAVIALKELKHLGRSQTSNTVTVSTAVNPGDLSEQQLEQLLAEKRLQHEQSLLKAGHSETNTVNASCEHPGVVGSPLVIDVSIEGVISCYVGHWSPIHNHLSLWEGWARNFALENPHRWDREATSNHVSPSGEAVY